MTHLQTVTLTVTASIAEEICHALNGEGMRWNDLTIAALNGENDLAPDACRSISSSAFKIRRMIREQMSAQIGA